MLGSGVLRLTTTVALEMNTVVCLTQVRPRYQDDVSLIGSRVAGGQVRQHIRPVNNTQPDIVRLRVSYKCIQRDLLAYELHSE